ncbi:peptidase domain-containing ABC transporter [Vibrio sp. 16]|uniref:peptidase domain-containing ABC transporter n=1 Tax=Vibrio sp. 16 TaxID=391586 RepID=UPI00018F40D9|nr:peptidase domain-containing ABC transporter [Vibrio sp. 16]EED25393.1 colicin V secretion/processing ATP-binding protein CvaB [Vibrio sp. 16]CAK4076531.1 unnamed protein product [Vibrio sp. 16]
MIPPQNKSISPLDLLSYSFGKRVPLIMQSEVAECGLASLAMIACYHGHKINIAAIRQHITLSSKGMNLKQIMQLASRFNLTSRAIQCDLEEVTHLTLPCLIHWNLDHFVVLTHVNKQSLTINDPALGRRTLSWQEFSDSYTGIALELTPNSDFKPQDQRIVMKISQLWEKISGLKRSLAALFGVSLVIQFTALTSPYYIQWVVDHVLLSYDEALLFVLAIGFAILTVIQTIVNAFRSWLLIRLSSAMNIQMGANLFHHLIRLPMAYFEKRHIGDIVSRFGSMNAIRDLLTTDVIEALIDGLMAFVVLLVMYLYSPLLANLSLSVVFVSFVSQLIFYYPNRQITEESIVAEAKEDSSFLETIRAIQVIKLFNNESMRQNTWLNRYADVINTDIKIGKLSIAEEALQDLLFGLETVLIVYLGALTVMEGELTVGMLLAFIAYKRQFTTNVLSFIDKMFAFKLLSLYLERLSDITLEPQETSLEHDKLPAPIRGHISVERLSFRYCENSPWILKDISFEIQPGECIAITGASGCGKTTLSKLILGLLKPTHGKVCIDGHDISRLSIHEYRSLFGCVMQEDTLLSGTLLENITMFDPHYNEERLQQCCQQAQILDDIFALPMGFYSLVGDMGNHFSGGQLQRLFLARALYKSPKILCLDEASSHLDIYNENAINQYIRQLNMTRVIIAHRQETILAADRAIYLEKPSS